MQSDRWALKTLDDTLVHSQKRNSQGIRVVLDPLSSVVKDEKQLANSIERHIDCLNMIRANGLYASLTVKLSALGMSFDKEQCRESYMALADYALKNSVPIELDMEGKPSVDFTIATAIAAADEGYRVTLAVQAYLDRTPSDITTLIKEGVTIRLVKGAYQGDVKDHAEIQSRMIRIGDDLLTRGKKFGIGTHDIEVIEHFLGQRASRKQVEFGMLMGLGDVTKIRLSTGEMKIAEYVPYGEDFKEYVKRREVYLKRLQEGGLTPAP